MRAAQKYLINVREHTQAFLSNIGLFHVSWTVPETRYKLGIGN